MADRICSHNQCGRKVLARGMCSSHYSSWHRAQRKYTITCEACGRTAQVERKRNKHCSYQCGMNSVNAAKVGMPVQDWMELPHIKDGVRRPSRATPSKLKQCEWCLQLHQDKSKFCSDACSNEKKEATAQFNADRKQQMLFRTSFEDGDYATFFNELRHRVYIDRNGCWIWARKLKNGYPVVTWRHAQVQVHRLSLEAKHGKPLGTQQAHHMCGVSACVNPDHLQPVTHRENMAEMMQRHSYLRRIAELEEALTALDPSHPVLNRIEVA